MLSRTDTSDERDVVGAQRPVLMGSLDGARSLALLAATRPARVSGLIAFAPSARGGAASAPEHADSVAQAIAELTSRRDEYPVA